MLEKNAECVVTIENFGANGEGVARLDGYAVFVPYSLPGETVRVRIVKAKNGYAFAKVVEVVEPSPLRRSAECPVFYKCGGCNLQHIKYGEQLKIKSSAVADCLKRIGDIDYNVPLTVSCGSEFRYRNKLQLPVRHTPKGNLIGFFREGSHDVVPIEDCYIQRKWCFSLIRAVKEYISESGVTCFDESTGKGCLKHIVAREVEGQLIVALVAAEKQVKDIERFVDILKKNFQSFSLFINYNFLNNNVVFGKEKTYSEVNGIKTAMGPESFMQVNDEVRDGIYSRVASLIGGSGKNAVIDAYSGAGYLTALLARHAARAFGVECVREAVDCADRLAEENCLSDKVTNVCGKCEDVLPGLIRSVSAEYDAVSVVLDPPRKGCDVAVVNSLIDAKPQKIVYISCNPATLARDVGILTGRLKYEGNELKRTNSSNGIYGVESVQPFDMFPNTKHIETVVCLTRNF